MALREEITDRTQAESELVGDFLACMRGLYSRADPALTEQSQVRYAHRNLLSQFRVAIAITDQTTMESLESAAIRHEKILETAGTRRPPPKPEHSLCPTFAFKGPPTPSRPVRRPFFKSHAAQDEEETEPLCDEDIETEYVDAARDVRKPRKTPVTPCQPPRVTASPAAPLAWQGALPLPKRTPVNDPLTYPGNQTRQEDPRYRNPVPPSRTPGPPRPDGIPRPYDPAETLCWNCKKRGHRHRDCTEPRRVFCYRCSQSGVTTHRCPFCNPGNESWGA